MHPLRKLPGALVSILDLNIQYTPYLCCQYDFGVVFCDPFVILGVFRENIGKNPVILLANLPFYEINRGGFVKSTSKVCSNVLELSQFPISAVFRWAVSIFLFKYPAERRQGSAAAQIGDFRNGSRGVFQRFFSFRQANVPQAPGECLSQMHPEEGISVGP